MTYAILDYGVNEMTMKEDLSTEADRMIETVTQLMSGQMERMLISISQGEFGVLKFLADCGKGVTSNEICRALCIGPGGVSNLLKALEKKGMIVKVHDLADRRANRVSITEQGRKSWMSAMSWSKAACGSPWKASASGKARPYTTC